MGTDTSGPCSFNPRPSSPRHCSIKSDRDFALTSKRGHDAPEIHFCGQCPKRYSGYKSWYDRYIKAHGKQTSIYLGVEIIDMDEIQG
ncbi:uncharacterized protein N7473_004753 [Penicillium subrubescens]|uniref:uncharacterized protein n=1 Tax=Penicillium subrubescens TaxID=1316194 RepID=UPI00254546A2|nr:uncharacterized protein N7473_004753 [Penicillium subrubescens]KAJ5900683.1 hypothetical protein N7473_004753 [Penicillium subrubescens]